MIADIFTPRPRGLAALRTAGIALATVAAAAVGVRLGDEIATPAPQSPPAVIDAGVARLPIPDGWSPGAPRFGIAGVRAAAGLWGVSADAVVAIRRPEDPSLLPAQLLRRAGAAPRPRPLVGGDVEGWRYEFAPRGGAGGLSVVVLPATSGVVTLGCVSATWSTASPGDDCVELAQEIELTRGTWLKPGPDTALRMALPQTLERLNANRRAGRRALAAAGSARARARATRSVGGAYAAAHDTLRPLAGPGRAATLASLLGRLAVDHRRLATAHVDRRPRLAVRAGAGIQRREARLERLIADLAPAPGAR
ncbi:MAG TPA: hypothetical protein VD836_09660 [Solirubrobacteraceae bacterium]|nr:hypothetical protein [Solirubrobacteraceae bacterium]